MARHPGQVVLLPAVQHGGHNRDAYASADVSGQVHQPRGGIVLFFRQERIRRGVDGNEQERQSHGLDHPGVDHGPEINSQGEVGHVKQGEGKDHQSIRHHLAGVEPGEHEAHQRHQQHQAEAAR